MKNPPKTGLPKTPQAALIEKLAVLPLLEAAGLAKSSDLTRIKTEMATFERHLANLDYFEHVYAPLGWTPYDNLDVKLLERLSGLDMAEAELALTEHYLDADPLKLFAFRFRRPAYVAWRDLFAHTVERLIASDFLSAVPLLLIIVDGVCQHHLQKSAFGGAADQEVFDSMTNTPNGLKHALALAGRTRKKLFADAIDAPYRNGILHGRDVNFGHAIVAAKAVNLLHATVDYIDKRADEHERIAKAAGDQRPPDWAAYLASRDRQRQFTASIEAWRPRPPREGVFASHESATGLEQDSPEYAAVAFLKAAASKNFGKLAELTLDYTRRAPKKWAGDIRRDYDDLGLQRWTFGWLNDTAAAASEGMARVSGVWRGHHWSGQIVLRLMFIDDDVDPLPRSLTGGRWAVAPSALGDMWRLAFAAARTGEKLDEAS